HRALHAFPTRRSSDLGPQGFALPVRIAGYSGKAVEVAARHASIFELPPGPPGEIIVTIERVRNAARSFGRSHKIRFSQWIHVHEDRKSTRLNSSHVKI